MTTDKPTAAAHPNDPSPDRKTSRIQFTRAGVIRGGRDLAPLMLAMVPYGMAFGVAAMQKGLDPSSILLLSAFVFAGSSQFAALDLWVGPLSLVPIWLTTLALNARHLLYGAALYPWLRSLRSSRRFPIVAVLTDSTYVYATQAEAKGERDAGVLLGAGGLTWLVWVLSTALGAYLGGAIADPKMFGIDVVMAAFFAVSLTGLWKGSATLKPWAAAAVASLLGLWTLPTGWHVIAGGLAGGIVGVLTDTSLPKTKEAADGH
jgi:4-azaleucine resistance transporter AzlC